MGKKKTSKAKAKKKRYDDASVYTRPSKDEPSFPCPRCQTRLASAAQLPDHQLDVHAYGNQGATSA
jgi:hypothetical protein